jgi:hypothetical protein
LCSSRKLQHLFGFGHIPPERFFTSYPDHLALPGFQRVDNFFHHLYPGKIRGTYPESIDVGVGNHVRNRSIAVGLSDIQLSSQGCRFLCCLIFADNTQDVGIPHTNPRADVESSDESSSDDADTNSFFPHICLTF